MEGKVNERKYLSCAETAKLLRQALKETFPRIKFSVRSSVYAGGASIRVGWLNGPSADQVKKVTGPFAGSYFDGMIDYKGSRYATLDGKPTRFGADFIFTERSFGESAVDAEIALQVAKWGIDEERIPARAYRVAAFRNGELYNVPAGAHGLASEINAGLAETTFCLNSDVRPSATLARVKDAGDDGYGQGTVGTPENPGGGRGYAGVCS